MSGKVLGPILVVVGIVLFVAVAAFLTVGRANNQLGSAGMALGLVLMLVVVLPLVAAGVVLYVKGSREAAEMAEVEKEKKLLGLIEARGKVSLAEAALDLGEARDNVKNYVYDLVAKGLFSGYANWKDGFFMSQKAGAMPKNNCPNCGGQLELAGKGTVQCPYCGTEIFLPQ
jgi:hypothetical protein